MKLRNILNEIRIENPNSIENIFFNFLKKEGAYEAFIENSLEKFETLENIRNFLSRKKKKNSSNEFISRAFVWDDSNQGWKYWKELNSKWKEIVKYLKLNEIKIEKPLSVKSKENITIIREYLGELVYDEIKKMYNSSYLLDFYFTDPDTYDVLRNFIIDQMIFSNYEIYRNKEEILVSHNNRNLINKNHIKDYINENKNIQKYLKKLIIKFCYENINEREIISSILEILENNSFTSENLKLYIRNIFDGLEHLYDFNEIFDDNLINFPNFLSKEFKKSDIIDSDEINEIKVLNPVIKFPIKVDSYDYFKKIIHILSKYGYKVYNYDYTHKNDSLTLLNSEYFDESFPLYIVDKGDKIISIKYSDEIKLDELDEIKVVNPSKITIYIKENNPSNRIKIGEFQDFRFPLTIEEKNIKIFYQLGNFSKTKKLTSIEQDARDFISFLIRKRKLNYHQDSGIGGSIYMVFNIDDFNIIYK